ncbi:MAG: peptidase T [Clostridia bacterium]|nr:peptidase T [Clostridia bacterium]
MSVKEKFLRYVRIDTQSNPQTGAHPSTVKQFDLANVLVKELEEIGLSNVRVDEHCYVYAELPANQENLPALGFIAHLDTEPVCSGKDVQPQEIVYDGGDILLKNGKVISPAEFPVLENYKNQTLIVTDGSTLLGADDKAGVAEIMTAMEYLVNHPEMKHGKIGVAFTPDEEIGEGASLFDVKGFGCDFAYTVDGEEIGELGYETFNAAEAVVTLTGKNIHPGSAKGKMINCAVITGELLSALPETERPETTELREGFYHVCDVQAEVEKGKIELIIRDHDKQKFEEKKEYIQSVCRSLQEKYGENAVSVAVRDQYYNCLEKIKEHFHLIENAKTAYLQAGVTPIEAPVRGGTDGCTLSFMGLPCPNLFTGGHNAHSVLEFIPVPSMEKAVEVIVNLVKLYGKN